MRSKEHQHTVGIPAKRRGQQMGRAGNPDQNREVVEQTPALRGRLKKATKMFADESSQQISSSAATPRTNSPSTPAMNTGGHPGETTGEIVFKQGFAERNSQCGC